MSHMDYTTAAESRSLLQRAPAIAQRATALLPYARFLPRHPALWIGAAVLGAAGAMAWKNRARIAERTRPVLQNAADRARPVLDAASERIPWTRSSGTPAGVSEDLR
jgi:hypothetical protein